MKKSLFTTDRMSTDDIKREMEGCEHRTSKGVIGIIKGEAWIDGKIKSMTDRSWRMLWNAYVKYETAEY